MPRLISGLLLVALTAEPVLAQLELPSSRDRRSPSVRRGDLILPDRGQTRPAPESRPARPAAPEREEPEVETALSAEAAALPLGSLGPRALALHAQLLALADAGSRAGRELGLRLLEAGPEGLAAARLALAEDRSAALLISSRHLLSHGEAGDMLRVRDRLRGRFTGQNGAQLLRSSAELAPEVIDSGLLVDLLDHPQQPMRAASERLLWGRVEPALIAQLVRALHASRADTRLRAVEVLGRIEDPASIPPLLERLTDSSAQVAFRAAEWLGSHPDPGLDRRLVDRAFQSRTLFRDQAYALLAVIEREDHHRVALLDELHAEVLLANLSSSLPLVRGAAAAALAGVGFRSEDPTATAWLDLEVPHELVRALVAETFHRDFSAVQGPARRRLALLAGIDHGGDGPAWQQWWSGAAREFRARRAVLRLEEGAERALRVRFRPVGGLEELVLAGPGVREVPRGLGEVFHLGEAETLRLAGRLAELGIFGAERLPGRIGRGAELGLLEVLIGDQGKTFQLGTQELDPWVETLLAELDRLVDANRWQRLRNPLEFPTRRAFADSEGPWWRADPPEDQARLRSKRLALSALEGAGALERTPLVAELVRLSALPGVLEPADVPALLGALAVEPFFNDRAVTLARLVGKAARGAWEESAPLDGAVARDLVATLSDAFGAQAGALIAEVLADAPPETARRLAADRRDWMRALAPAPLALSGDPEDRALLAGLMQDTAPEVEAAAVAAVGEARVSSLRPEVLARARFGQGPVRQAALVAIGRLGGEGAHELLIAGLGLGGPEQDAAVAEGLAELADGRSTSALITLLHSGATSPAYAQARRALVRIGPAAWPELMRVAQSTTSPARRTALLLLAEQGVSLVVPQMLVFASAEGAGDPLVWDELVILTGVDLRRAPDPVGAWWDWWDASAQEDSRLWLRVAQEREGLPLVPLESPTGPARGEIAESLYVSVLKGSAPVAERARRELQRVHGDVLPPLPQGETRRATWVEETRALLAKKR